MLESLQRHVLFDSNTHRQSTDCLFAGRFSNDAAVQKYVHSLESEMSEHISESAAALNMFVDKGDPSVN